MSRTLRRGCTGVAVLLIGCAALLGCGGSSSDDEGTTTTLEGTDYQHLTCSDWDSADESRQDEIIAGFRAILGGQVTGRHASGRGSVLDDDYARRLFDNYCQQTFARAFMLYKLYGQASGFAGQSP
jgi:hypothetical protein